MAIKVIQFRGGTKEEHLIFVGDEREVTIDTTDNRLVVHDGVTSGGHPIAIESDNPVRTGDLENDVYWTQETLTNISQLENDAGYVTHDDISKVSDLTNDAGYITGYCSYCSYCSYCTNCS